MISEEGLEVRVEGITDTGRFEKVYNLRVADNHTYYVGSAAWGFDVWVHNTCAGIHHFWPVSMGSLLRKGTLRLNAVKHTDLHKALNQHLNGIGKFVEGEWVTMWARKGNRSGQVSFYNSIKRPDLFAPRIQRPIWD